MKSLLNLLFISILFLGSQSALSQERGIVKFFVEVDNGYFEIEINDTMLLRRYKDTLPAGTYEAKVWSPGYVLTPIDFTVEAGKTVEKHVKMVKNNDFMQYERDYKDYRMQFHKQFTIPLSVTLLSAVTTGAFGVRAYDTKKEITSDIDLYYKSPVTSELDAIKTRVAANNKIYNRQRAFFYANAGLTAVCVAGTIWSLRNFNQNNTEPTYQKVSPFKDKYSLNITPYGCGLTIHL